MKANRMMKEPGKAKLMEMQQTMIVAMQRDRYKCLVFYAGCKIIPGYQQFPGRKQGERMSSFLKRAF
jgi:hypothetical protein